MVVDEAHGFTGPQRIQRPEDRGVAEALGDAACVKRVNGVRREVRVGLQVLRGLLGGHVRLLEWGGIKGGNGGWCGRPQRSSASRLNLTTDQVSASGRAGLLRVMGFHCRASSAFSGVKTRWSGGTSSSA
jgi:hypothetical protein